jgi:hypothetical protein
MTPKILITLCIVAEGAYWVWLFLGAHHGRYPVTSFGWISLIGDPIVFVLFVAVYIASRKYRGTGL